ncbi:MAG: primosomal protein N', partial [Caldimonas sp.]
MAIDAPQHADLIGPLTYASESGLAPGTLVRAPLGRREVTGVVWPAEGPSEIRGELRALGEALTALPALALPWCRLVEFAAAYYQRGIGEVALSVLPPELRKLGNAQIANRIAKLEKSLAHRPQAAPASEVPPTLSAAQAAALDAIAALDDPKGASGARTVLLHGVTGSGK